MVTNGRLKKTANRTKNQNVIYNKVPAKAVSMQLPTAQSITLLPN